MPSCWLLPVDHEREQAELRVLAQLLDHHPISFIRASRIPYNRNGLCLGEDCMQIIIWLYAAKWRVYTHTKSLNISRWHHILRKE